MVLARILYTPLTIRVDTNTPFVYTTRLLRVTEPLRHRLYQVHAQNPIRSVFPFHAQQIIHINVHKRLERGRLYNTYNYTHIYRIYIYMYTYYNGKGVMM